MLTAKSIKGKQKKLPHILLFIINTYRRFYAAKYNENADSLTNEEILFSWRQSYLQTTVSPIEDELTLEHMRKTGLEKLKNEGE